MECTVQWFASCENLVTDIILRIEDNYCEENKSAVLQISINISYCCEITLSSINYKAFIAILLIVVKNKNRDVKIRYKIWSICCCFFTLVFTEKPQKVTSLHVRYFHKCVVHCMLFRLDLAQNIKIAQNINWYQELEHVLLFFKGFNGVITSCFFVWV